MRQFEILDQFDLDNSTGVAYLTTKGNSSSTTLALRREGNYVAISANHGPLEIAMRPRYQELARVLARLQPVEGLQTTRRIGTGQSYVEVGLDPKGILLMRLTIVADATGHFSINLEVSDEARQALFAWLPINAEA